MTLPYSEMCGSDTRMDNSGNWDDPLNPLPVHCKKCGFPKINLVPQPYFLLKSRSMNNNLLSQAELGNFFVKPKAKQIMERITPGQCRFFPTHYKGTDSETPWLLAVPVHFRKGCRVKSRIERCSACGEPASAHWGTQFHDYGEDPRFDITKDEQWNSKGSDAGWKYRRKKGQTEGPTVEYLVDRNINFSNRLSHLFKKLKLSGLFPVGGYPTLTRDEKNWVEEKLALVGNDAGLKSPESIGPDEKKWFRKYLAQNSSKTRKPQAKSIERKLGFQLPKSYVEFLSKVGPRSFHDVDGLPGFTVHILTPDQFDLKEYRKGRVGDDDESLDVDGIMFARTDHGDCYCFDLKPDRAEYEVFYFNHEMMCFEPYAATFVHCLRRWNSAELESEQDA